MRAPSPHPAARDRGCYRTLTVVVMPESREDAATVTGRVPRVTVQLSDWLFQYDSSRLATSSVTGTVLPIEGPAAHYLGTVMRSKAARARLANCTPAGFTDGAPR